MPASSAFHQFAQVANRKFN